MELQTNNTLDFRLTKEDMIDMLIDEKLTAIEKEIALASERSALIDEEIKKIKDKRIAIVNKRLIKHLPTGLNPKDMIKIHCLYGYLSTNVSFEFKGFTVRLSGEFNTELKYTPEEKELIENYKKEKNIIDFELNELKLKHNELNTNNKRIKAQMVRTFLKATEEGKKLLKVLNDAPKM